MNSIIFFVINYINFIAHDQLASPNPCAVDNGGCDQLCLLSATSPSGYSCACSDGFLPTDSSSAKCEGSLISTINDSHMYIYMHTKIVPFTIPLFFEVCAIFLNCHISSIRGPDLYFLQPDFCPDF